MVVSYMYIMRFNHIHTFTPMTLFPLCLIPTSQLPSTFMERLSDKNRQTPPVCLLMIDYMLMGEGLFTGVVGTLPVAIPLKKCLSLPHQPSAMYTSLGRGPRTTHLLWQMLMDPVLCLVQVITAVVQECSNCLSPKRELCTSPSFRLLHPFRPFFHDMFWTLEGMTELSYF